MNHQMLTKRIYFTISCIMLLVLFLFQGSSLVRQKYNRYDENIYANETAPFDAGTQFTVQTDSAAVLSDSHAFVVFIGDTDSASDRKSTRLNSSHWNKSRMPSSA